MCHHRRNYFILFICSFADKTETNVIAVICKISKEFQIMCPTINIHQRLEQTFIVGVYFKRAQEIFLQPERVSMQCHAINNEVFNCIKSATAASFSGTVLIITNLVKPQGSFYPLPLSGKMSIHSIHPITHRELYWTRPQMTMSTSWTRLSSSAASRRTTPVTTSAPSPTRPGRGPPT